jgi:mannose-6-phosphate isomerase-like protein (cupin superfamily)
MTLTLLAALAFLPSAALAQAAATPPASTEPLVVLSAEALAELKARLAAGGREDLVGKAGGTETAMFVMREQDHRGEAEIHRDADDYHFVLEGSGTYYLGGRLEAARETAPGEWRGTGISGGRTVEVKKGDLIFAPRGTAHQRVTPGRDITLMVIKVHANPTPKVTPAR